MSPSPGVSEVAQATQKAQLPVSDMPALSGQNLLSWLPPE